MNICIFGDSIAWGAYDTEHGGWATMLQKTLFSADPQHNVYDCSVCFAHTRSTLERLKVEMEARNPKLVIFALGVNDSVYFDTPDNPKVSQEDFVSNLRLLMGQAKTFTDRIVCIGLTHVDESKIPFEENGKQVYFMNERIDAYDALLEQTAREERAYYVKLSDIITEHELVDDVHPNTAGHKKMYEKIFSFLKESNLLK